MTRKLILQTAILVVFVQVGYAQNNCTPIFNSLANHKMNSCESKEFEKLELYKKDKKGETHFQKAGEFMKAAFSFTGDFNARPSEVQIYQNYVNAITKAGGEVLYNGGKGVYGKLIKSGDVYWIRVYTDGSGWYWLETVKEASMRQDVAVTADEINKTIREDGKIPLYGIYFDTDKAILKPESTPTLTSIAGFLTANPSITVFIVGHTDNTGDYLHNIKLSKERAAAVVNELVSKYKISKTRLIPDGVGPLAPVAANNTVEKKAKNRRVEVVAK